MEINEFLIHARLDREHLQSWVEAGWLAPSSEGEDWLFAEIDVARAQLIRDLKSDMGVNDEGIAIILDLLDQLYGVRGTLRDIASAIAAQDEPVRRRVLAQIRGAPLKAWSRESMDSERRV
ncbi:chaperone modulator CbpM [Bradyrhizobium sp. 131]|uniref:chaperone modulator CbpM n=1 Tax=Bradyrhizobium sp. 131 TaxID=2782609 RepID=UPI001FFFAE78|nr:chaperone modulator CbpM [Bradyrhizobium sp. 131]UPK19204.1 transcriptional regulator [Bradyrhizobium sp. 131]